MKLYTAYALAFYMIGATMQASNPTPNPASTLNRYDEEYDSEEENQRSWSRFLEEIAYEDSDAPSPLPCNYDGEPQHITTPEGITYRILTSDLKTAASQFYDLIKVIKKDRGCLEATVNNDKGSAHGTTLFMEVMKSSNPKTHAYALKLKPQVNRQDEDGHTALFYAVRNKHECSVQSVKSLLEQGANPLAAYKLPVFVADDFQPQSLCFDECDGHKIFIHDNDVPTSHPFKKACCLVEQYKKNRPDSPSLKLFKEKKKLLELAVKKKKSLTTQPN